MRLRPEEPLKHSTQSAWPMQRPEQLQPSSDYALGAARFVAAVESGMDLASQGERMASADLGRTWRKASSLGPGSAGWRYLADVRRLPAFSINNALHGGGLRESSDGTIWALHQGCRGQITGWEIRGPRLKAFSQGAGKSLFRAGEHINTTRLAVTESVIDALSLASLEGWQVGTLYASTGGGLTPATGAALQALLNNQVQLVDASNQTLEHGRLSGSLHHLARECGAEFSRLRPYAMSWNQQLAG